MADRGVVHLALASGDAHELLLALAQRVTGRGGWRLSHACPQCGSSGHGRPVLLGQGHAPHASLSRTDGQALVALCAETPVGVDLERPGAADGPGLPWELVPPRQVAVDDPTRAWVRTEARLKALGTGFSRMAAGHHHDEVGVRDLELDGWVAAVAVRGPGVPSVLRHHLRGAAGGALPPISPGRATVAGRSGRAMPRGDG